MGRTAGERLRCGRLRKNKGKAGDCFLTTRRSFGGRESSGEVDGGGDRRRQLEIKDGGGGFGWSG
jgi:hypothetical protein